MGVHDGNYKAAKKALGIPPDEPIFVIRGQDALATAIIARYLNLARNAECSDEFMTGLVAVGEEFAEWAVTQKTKVPD